MVLLVVTLGWSATAIAQGNLDAGVARVRQLARSGQLVQARTVIDSLIAATAVESARYPMLLLQRASIALNRVDADRDYEKIVSNYRTSPSRVEALLFLAQEAIAASEPDRAIERLRQLSTDYTTPVIQAEANYWGARALMEKGETLAACETNDRAASLSSSVNSELKNEITLFATKVCLRPAGGVVVSTTTDTAAAAPVVESSPAAAPAAKKVRPPTKTTTRPANVTQPPASVVTGKRSYAVQVAAFDTRDGAEKLVARLRRSGLAAHVDGTAKPFRVRIGRYATYGEATAALRDLKARKLSGFVAELQP